VMLGAIVSRPNEPAFMNHIASLATPAASPEAGAAFLALLFGSNASAVEAKIAQATSLSKPSAAVVLSATASLLLTVLSRKVPSSHHLHRRVTRELPNFASLVPAGVPGQSRLPALAASAASAARRKQHAHARAEAGKHWLWQVLLLGALLLFALVWYSYRGAAVVSH
jgi:hypothetical protein